MFPIKLFGWSSVCFGSFETLKLSVSVLKQNNRNKRFVSDSAETSFGSIVSKDTLRLTTAFYCSDGRKNIYHSTEES
jgi:hypothetical protein